MGVLQSDMDLGVLMEYLYDERGDAAPIAFENDLFIGLRLTANDAQSSELLTGVIRDLDSGALLFNLEASPTASATAGRPRRRSVSGATSLKMISSTPSAGMTMLS